MLARVTAASFVLGYAVLSLGACNTVEGFGKDIQSLGNAMGANKDAPDSGKQTE